MRLAASPSTVRRLDAARYCLRFSTSAHLSVAPRPIFFAKHALQQLAGRITRERRDEVDGLRTLVTGEALTCKRDDVRLRGRHTLTEHNRRFYRFTPLFIRHAEDGDFGDRRVRRERVFH